MNVHILIDALNSLDYDLIERYFIYKKALIYKKSIQSLLLKIFSSVACIMITISISLWLFIPINNGVQTAGYYTFQANSLTVEYKTVTEISRYEKFNLKNKIGELYYENNGDKLYKIKGNDSVDRLILCNSQGEYYLLEFEKYFDLDENVEITLGYIFESIYDIKTADNVKKIVFEKARSGNDKTIEGGVIVEKKSISEKKEVEEILKIFSSLKYLENLRTSSVLPYDTDYLDGKKPLSAQVERKVTVVLEDRNNFELIFYPFDRCVSVNGVNYGIMMENECERLTDIVEINMEYHNWGVPNLNSNDETNTPPQEY